MKRAIGMLCLCLAAAPVFLLLPAAPASAACGDAKTVLPEGLTAPASWPCGQE
ncbi:MAG: hypothetical protein RLN99_16165 [Kiloniellaceae bacterium]